MNEPVTDKQPTSKRVQVSSAVVVDTMDEIFNKLKFRLEQKGKGTFASRHEVLGCVTEEYTELIEAVQKGDLEGAVKAELMDVAISCIFGICCINQGTLEW